MLSQQPRSSVTSEEKYDVVFPEDLSIPGQVTITLPPDLMGKNIITPSARRYVSQNRTL